LPSGPRVDIIESVADLAVRGGVRLSRHGGFKKARK
jgi:hypothetical protein